ncbi:tyrosine-type recombinase/integrase [Pseudohalioglobus lutimaris]|uniref:Integrase n=1 Tax=Pseudohalioglobus lutimaris TaxID=1737061 RepID=A0A2N5WZS9_9GAMM|nr:site-specific integrase [Pseudohalioglobus lutimaris]PLW67750.1 integrase [Pseudohalioglobus lutimaris]
MELVVFRAHPVPLDGLVALPEELDGSQGDNRLPQDHCQIQADNDWQAIQCWLAEFEGSPQTHRNYRKEAERLLLWSIKERRRPISSLLREDFQAYQVFLANPQPEAYWCGPRSPRHSAAWKPFQGPLRESSQRQSLIVVNALLSYWVDAGYIRGNPLSLIRRRNKALTPSTHDVVAQERFLDQKTWEHLKGYIASLPQGTRREIEQFERVRFLFHFLFLLAPRVSEVASHSMNSFREFRGKWWWFVEGKGGKRAKVPVNDEMLDALMRYRRFLGLDDLPPEDDRSPIFRSIKGTSGVSHNMVHRLVKETVKGAADTLEAESLNDSRKLRRASCHWFRHTAVTRSDDTGIGIKYIQASARHEKLETTAIYQHAEDHRWHDEWQRLKY